MKFRCFGDLDAPDWILKEISILSKISAIKIRLVCAEISKHLAGGTIDYAKVAKDLNVLEEISDLKASIAALHFIIKSAAKYDVVPDTVAKELQQLGLPKEHTEAVTRVYSKERDTLRQQFQNATLRLNKLESLDWRIDFIVSSSDLKSLNSASVQLNLNVKNDIGDESKVEAHSFEVSAEKFRVLLHELNTARELISAISSDDGE